ncbi:MAG: TRAP transporter large permease subunit [Nitrospirae bacterium]|nr:TRAP transporter large permease subunit [Nitrospirota bacterium]
MILLLIVLLLLYSSFGGPLFTVMGGAALIGYYFVADVPTASLIAEAYRIASAPSLIAIPLFTFAGYILAESKAPERLVNLANAAFGWLPGGLSIVTLSACTIFTALTGASGVTIIALGGLLMPSLIKQKYPENFSLGLVTCCGSVGLLFPPSLPIIIYGIVAEVDVSKLFLAGIVPGVVIMVFLSIYAMFRAKRAKVPPTKMTVRGIGKGIKDAAWEIPIPFVILGGIYGGYYTAGEASAIMAFYVFIVEVFIRREVRFRDLPKIMKESMLLVGGILIILGMALGFTNFLIIQQVPDKIFEWINTYIHSQITFLVALNIFLLIVGCLMDIFSAIVVVVPLIVPIARNFGVDPIHLGIIFLTNLEIGYLTPPVGMNLFISSFRFQKPIVQLYRAAIPYIAVLVAALLVITYWPELSLWLVHRLSAP